MSDQKPTGPASRDVHVRRKNQSVDTIDITSKNYEFGGPLGALGMMCGFPALMYYMWIGAFFYDGELPMPAPDEDIPSFITNLGRLVCEHAFPHKRAWVIYWAFMSFQVFCYLYLPGVYGKGKPLLHLGGLQLEYYCSASWSWYTTIAAVSLLQITGLFRIQTLIDDSGPLMSVAICSGFIVSIIAYISAWYRGAQHRMTGNIIYDFFMGAELNPRPLPWLDLKMFLEIRPAWYMLFLITLGACAKQYDQFGYVSKEAVFLLLAHFLYANACCKGEQLILTTWDIYFEKCGFMIIFWTMAGVPMTYCHCAWFIARHNPEEYSWSYWSYTLLLATYLFAYWVWDTCGSQKNIYRAREQGMVVERKTFPQLPWRSISKPECLQTKTGNAILCNGWYGLARKVHYTCDIFFAIAWGLITGWTSPLPWFYPAFFVVMILHRAIRDDRKCQLKYGEAWEEYKRRVPYLFIPYLI